jgi:hypothetical protein
MEIKKKPADTDNKGKLSAFAKTAHWAVSKRSDLLPGR